MRETNEGWIFERSHSTLVHARSTRTFQIMHSCRKAESRHLHRRFAHGEMQVAMTLVFDAGKCATSSRITPFQLGRQDPSTMVVLVTTQFVRRSHPPLLDPRTVEQCDQQLAGRTTRTCCELDLHFIVAFFNPNIQLQRHVARTGVNVMPRKDWNRLIRLSVLLRPTQHASHSAIDSFGG